MDRFNSYIDSVLCMIRSPLGRTETARELRGHLEDHADHLSARGVPLPEAQQKAVAAMGDPYALGRDLDRFYPYCPPRWTILLLVLSAILWGLMFREAGQDYGSRLDRRFSPSSWTASDTVQTHLIYTGHEYAGSVVLLRSGSLRGGGALGAYTFSASGDALLFHHLPADTDETPREPWYELRLPAALSRSRLSLDTADTEYLTARLDGAQDLTVSYSPLRETPLRAEGYFSLRSSSPFPAEGSIRISAPNGDTAVFYCHLGKEVKP